ncbi:MAG: type I DNA topoisomerase [Ignavibacteria bacterium]|nr:type I DNA topoisomerase [Ignavibacteria bacterium]
MAKLKVKNNREKKNKSLSGTSENGKSEFNKGFLVIVESPSKAKTINKYLGKTYKVIASVGHIKNLPKSKISIDFDNDYKMTYEIIPGKEKVISELKSHSSSYDKIYIATDPDREGEAIAYDIAEEIKKVNPNIYRVLFNEITKKGIEDGINNPLRINEKLVYSQQARRALDRIVGYKVSPFLWKVIFYGLSAGRVQSVALRLICEREEEIRNFVPTEYWSVLADFRDTEKNKVFESKLISKNNIQFKFNGEDPRIKDEHEANSISDDLKTKSFRVSDIIRKEVRRNPYAPFTTSSMQQDASVRLRFAPKRTMMIAQKLYEGVNIDEGLTGLITYMRTDSTRVSDDAIKETRNYILENYGTEFLPEQPRVFSKKNINAQDAHEAIRPTSVERTPEKIRKYLTDEQFKLYELIWKRFVASQMESSISDQITLLIDSIDDGGNSYQFRTTVSNLKFKGFLAVYEDSTEDKEESEEEFPIPEEIEIGDTLDLQEVFTKQHFTSPPPRYTESSLIKQLDNLGIGRPSTYALIVSTIINRTYVELKDRKLYATELGETVNRLLTKYFSDIVNVKFTAEMEEELDKIAEGKLTYKQVLDDFYIPFSKDLDILESKTKEIKQSLTEATDIDCEMCGKKMIIKWGRNGRFLSCTGYPKCKNSKPLPSEEEQHQEIAEGKFCSECGAQMLVKSSKYGKFLGCSRYPECKNIQPITLGIKCPKCSEGEILERKSSKSRKVFYGCTRYPDCDFISNYKPVSQSCEICSNSYMLSKYSKKKGEYLECPSCKHQVILVKESSEVTAN